MKYVLGVAIFTAAVLLSSCATPTAYLVGRKSCKDAGVDYLLCERVWTVR